ncbi:uncharacterized protein LOC110431637 [Sorghum bicolor]|uniref:uncharacterized protein LOC110431637 n=1 Tax=Sorghum bicolor TaxID=4558 RepID=UPI0002207022|nr:uncharacterized protein LOC110431637 [Sorghum bicolor]|eukprot:XP_021306516.1 uncharacterized protein LOC110431637 [Sorghum bicolor]
MLHQENSEAFVRHHSEQLACSNMRGADNGRPNFLPEKCQIAVCQRGEKVDLFDEELVQGVHLANPTVHSPLVPSGVKETPIVDHNKRPASSDMLDIVECKRLKQEDQIVTKEDNHTSAVEDFREYPTYTTCERSFDSPLYESEESEDEGVDSPLHYSHAHTYVEDDLWPASFHQSVGPFPSRKAVPIGPNHQAELPECRPFSGRTEEGESVKWIRNGVIPMPGTDASSLVLEPVHCKAGCECLDEGSINCVKKHVREAREKLKGSVGSDAFRELGFYDMGEEVASRWTEEEEHLFQQVVLANPASLRRNFWDELPLAFPSKSSKELVSYYFNVFMLRKRAEQNRFDPMNIDSDDDEWQAGGDGEFPITGRADEYLPTESLTDQDDIACNPVPLEEDFYEDSDDEDELDNASGDRHNGCQRASMLSEGHPVMSFIDNNQQTFKLDADAQDDSCTSFEAHQVGVEGGTHTDIADGSHYRSDGFGGGAEHGFFGDHCDTKEWDFGFSTGWEKHDFLSTNNVIEEVFGKGSSEDGSDTATGQGLL